MKIEFDTATATLKDATALVTTLFVLFPNLGEELDGVTFGLKGDERVTVTQSVGDISLTVTGDADAVRAFAPPMATPAAPAAEVAFAQAGSPTVETATDEDGSSDDETSAPAAAPAGAASAGELDVKGLPWDERIHAVSKGKNNDGSWRGKKGVDKALVPVVIAELRQTYPEPTTAAPAAPAPVAPVPPAPAPAAEVPPPPSAPVAPVPVAVPVPSAAAPDATPAPAPTAPDGAPSAVAEFARVMREVTKAQTEGRISAETTAAAVQAVGLTSMAELLKRPDLIPTFEATYQAMLSPAAA